MEIAEESGEDIDYDASDDLEKIGRGRGLGGVYGEGVADEIELRPERI